MLSIKFYVVLEFTICNELSLLTIVYVNESSLLTVNMALHELSKPLALKASMLYTWQDIIPGNTLIKSAAILFKVFAKPLFGSEGRLFNLNTILNRRIRFY